MGNRTAALRGGIQQKSSPREAALSTNVRPIFRHATMPASVCLFSFFGPVFFARAALILSVIDDIKRNELFIAAWKCSIKPVQHSSRRVAMRCCFVRLR